MRVDQSSDIEVKWIRMAKLTIVVYEVDAASGAFGLGKALWRLNSQLYKNTM